MERDDRETRLRVAYQGEPGAYSEAAVLQRFGIQALPMPQPSFSAVFQAVAAGTVTVGLVPIEHAHTGRIAEVDVLLLRPDIAVTGELWQPIRHCLLALPGQRLSDIRQVWSHPHALAECKAYLDALPVEIITAADTAGSAKLIRQQALSGIGAIASARAADLYQLAILARDIQDHSDNRTCFLILRKAEGLVREEFALLRQLKTFRKQGQGAQARVVMQAMEQRDQAEEWGMRYGC